MTLKQNILFFLRNFIFLLLFLLPIKSYASFIESTIGTAIVNDATASYYNPAALTLLKNPQIITLGSFADFHTRFNGQTIQNQTGFVQSGTSTSQTNYFLPALYLGMPSNERITIGLAIVSNIFNTEVDDNSILRYVQSGNRIQNIDVIPAIGVKCNDFLSVGVGANFSYADFLMQPVSGFPTLVIADEQSRNDATATGVGGDIGFLLKPFPATLMGFNYRTAVTYRFKGKSVLETTPEFTSDHYHFSFWTPARSVFSVTQGLTDKFFVLATLQYIQWSIFDDVTIHRIATQVGSQQAIVNTTSAYHFRDTWLVTLGGHYRITPKCVIRAAGSYVESPASGQYQLSTGNSIILGTSIGYKITKNITVDGSYAHAFIQDESIHILTTTNRVNGTNSGYCDAVSLKLTINV